MPVKPSDCGATARKQRVLDHVYASIDQLLSSEWTRKDKTIHFKQDESIMEQVVVVYRKIGWIVEREDYDSFTKLTFSI